MLVNISRFTDVQNKIAETIRATLEEMKLAIRNFSQLPPEEACKNTEIKKLRSFWEKNYKDAANEWIKIQKALNNAAQPIEVRAVNRSTGAASLDYAKYEENGLRVVAVGGNSLSRGLTLNGLCISYFYRNSQMYDTLMQMGRWFGYRDGYEDLCRIWMSDDSRQWYSHISLATNELREEIRKMKGLGRTPKDFGLKVRAHPDSLLVTARNKMRTAKEIEKLISLNHQSIETPRLSSKPEVIKANSNAAAQFIKTLLETQGAPDYPRKHALWKNVPKSIIINLLTCPHCLYQK
jgi:hypothetical protein